MTGSSTLKVDISYSNEIQGDPTQGTITDSFGPTTYSANSLPGTGTNQADRWFRDYQTLANASLNYVLSALANGQNMARVTKLFVQILSGTGSLAIIPGPSNGWQYASEPSLKIGGVFLKCWPDATAAPAVSGTSDQFTLTATGTVTFRMVVEGRSA